jgi:hypothetical protein
MYKQPYLLNFVKSLYVPLSKNGMNRVIAFWYHSLLLNKHPCALILGISKSN